MNRLRFPKTTVGIEIAGAGLRIAVVRSLVHRLQLVGTYDVPGFGECSDEDKRNKIQELRQRHPIPNSRVYLILPQSAGVTRQMEFPAVVGGGRGKLGQVVGLQLETLSPWPLEEIYWGFSEHPATKGAQSLTVTVVVIPKSVLDPHIALLTSAGLPLDGVSLSASSWAAGAGVLWEDGPPTLILGCEQRYVEGALLDGQKLFLASETGEPALAARKVVDQLLALGRVGDPERIRLLGHGAALDSLPDQEPVVLPLANAPLASAHRYGAIAAALLGMGHGPFVVNVLPFEMRRQSNIRQLIPTAALVLLAMAAGILLLVREPYQNRLYAARIDAEIQRVAAGAGEVATLSERLDAEEERYRTLAGHIQNQDRNLEVMNVLATLLPEADWVSSYDYQDGRVTLQGFAADTASLQRVLEDSPLVRDVRFTAPMTRSESGRDRFTMQFNVETTP